MVAYSALLCLSYSASINAQDFDPLSQATGNLITGTWTGAPGSTVGPGGLSGGSTPVYNTNTGTLQFGYTQRTVSQSIAINQALANAGTGVQVNGFQYGWNYFNQDMNRGTLTGNISLTSNTGAVLQSYTYSMPQTTGGWTNMSGAQNFVTPYALNAVGNLNVSFTGKDDRFWAGYYGPLVKDIDVRLRYGVDPCATNPAYSPNCAGFSSVVTSPNLVPYPDAYAVFGGGVSNSFAINKAFETAGVGLQIHGFKWGYVANANGPYCAFQFIVCWDERNPSVTTNVNITSNTGASLYNVTRTYQNSYNTTNYQYLFPSSQQLGNLGSFNFTATANDQAYVGQMWSRALYTPDQCMRDPLSSINCPGYWKAFAAQSANTTTTTTTSTTTATADTSTPITADVVQPTTSSPTTSSTTTVTTGPTPTTTATADTAQPATTSSSTSSSTSSAPTTATATAPTTTVTPTATNPQPKVGEVATAGSQSSSSKNTMSTGQLLSIVSSEQSKVSKLEMATAQAAVEQAKSDAAKVTNEAQQVAATQQAQTLSNAQAVVASVTPTGQTSSQSNSNLQASSGFGINLFSAQGTGVGVNLLRGPDLYSLTSSSQSMNYGQPTVQSSTPIALAMMRREQETSKAFEQNSAFEQKQSLSATNPLATMMTPPMLAPPPPAPTGPSVNAKTKDNDAAGGVNLASIAKQPQGFELYMSGLQDRPFYAPKEIYKGQKVVDNARAQRSLSGASDRLHQEMVDQQYKIGN